MAKQLPTVFHWYSLTHLNKEFHNGRATPNCLPQAQFTTSLQQIPQWQSNFQLSSTTGTVYHIVSKEFHNGKATSNCLPLAQFTTFSPKNSKMAKQLPTFLHWPSFPNSLQRIPQWQSNLKPSSAGPVFSVISKESHNGSATSNCPPLAPFSTFSPKNYTVADQLPTVLHWHSFPNLHQRIQQWQSNFQLSSTGTVYHILSKEFHDGKATSNCLPLVQFITSQQKIPQWQSNSQLSSTGTVYHISPTNSTMAEQLPTVFHHWHSLPHCLQRVPQWQSNFQLSSTGTVYHILSKEFQDGKATPNFPPLAQLSKFSPKDPTMAEQPQTFLRWSSFQCCLQRIPQWQCHFQLSSTGPIFHILSKELYSGRPTSNCPPLAQLSKFTPKNSTVAKQLPTVFHWHSLPHSLQRIPRWQSNFQLSSTGTVYHISTKNSTMAEQLPTVFHRHSLPHLSNKFHNGRATSNYLPPLAQFTTLSPKSCTMAKQLPTVFHHWHSLPHSLQRIPQWQSNFQLSSTVQFSTLSPKNYAVADQLPTVLHWHSFPNLHQRIPQWQSNFQLSSPLAQFTTFSPKNSTTAEQIPTVLHWSSFPNFLQRIPQWQTNFQLSSTCPVSTIFFHKNLALTHYHPTIFHWSNFFKNPATTLHPLILVFHCPSSKAPHNVTTFSGPVSIILSKQSHNHTQPSYCFHSPGFLNALKRIPNYKALCYIRRLVLKKKNCFSAWASTLNMGLINKVDMVCLSPVGYGV